MNLKSFNNKPVTNINLVAEMVKAAVEEIAQSADRYTATTDLPIENRRIAVMGDILAAILAWNGEDIIKVAQGAMEDANFDGEVVYMEDGHIIEFEEGIDAQVEMFPREETDNRFIPYSDQP